jgi:hypothetical protein
MFVNLLNIVHYLPQLKVSCVMWRSRILSISDHLVCLIGMVVVGR